MQLVHSSSKTTTPSHHFIPLGPGLAGEAANDSGQTTRSSDSVDLNSLVARVVGHVTGRMQPKTTNVALTLAPGRPVVRGNAHALAFAISGVLGAELRTLEDNHEPSELRVAIQVLGETVKIYIAGTDVPPLGLVRALESGSIGEADPTVAHCRRLVEDHGGYIELTARDGQLGFAIVLPTLPAVCPIRLLPAETPRFAGPAERLAS